MKVKVLQLTEGTRNTHSATMSMALRRIASSPLETLQKIERDLETGLRQQKLNQRDAGVLLGKVRLEIANRHFH